MAEQETGIASKTVAVPSKTEIQCWQAEADLVTDTLQFVLR